MPEENVKLAKNELIEKGILPSYNVNGIRMGWIDGTNNWNAVCHGGLVPASLVIADINPELWTELIMENRKLVLDEISKFKMKLSELEDHIKRNDDNSVNSFLNDAKLKKKELNR